jgi:acyl-CoA thioester hydrolase
LVEYLGSARYDDVLSVATRVERLGRTSMTFQFGIFREDPQPAEAPLVTAELVYVNADPQSMKSVPLPAELRERVLAYERVAPQT